MSLSGRGSGRSQRCQARELLQQTFQPGVGNARTILDEEGEAGAVAAQVKGCSLEELSVATCATAERFFGKLLAARKG